MRKLAVAGFGSAMLRAMNPPAQELFTINEMRAVAAGGSLPDGFRERLERIVGSESFLMSPNVHFSGGSERTLPELLSFDEMRSHLAGDPLPGDFTARVADVASTDWCQNCGGQRCMGCVCREYDHDCANDCPNCC